VVGARPLTVAIVEDLHYILSEARRSFLPPSGVAPHAGTIAEIS